MMSYLCDQNSCDWEDSLNTEMEPGAKRISPPAIHLITVDWNSLNDNMVQRTS